MTVVNSKIFYNVVISVILCTIFFYSVHTDPPTLIWPFTLNVYATFIALAVILKIICRENLKALAFLICIDILITCHLFIANIQGADIQFSSFFRMLLLLNSFIYLGSDANFTHKLVQVTNSFSVWYFSFTLFLFLIGYGLVAIDDYGTTRFTGWMSEPSALAPFLSCMLINGIVKKRLFHVLLAVACAVAAFSATVIILMFLTCAIYFFWRKPLIFIVSSFALFGLVSIFTNDMILRLVQLVELILNGDILSFFEISNIRARTLKDTCLEMISLGDIFIGYGLNQEGPFFGNNDYATLSELHLMVKSFGAIGLIFIAGATLYMCLFALKNKIFWVCPFVLYALINSAEGELISGFWWIAFGYIASSSAQRHIKNGNLRYE